MQMSAFDTTAILVSLVAIACGLLILDTVLRVKRDSREPPFVPSNIPYFGHIIGLFWHKNRYYAKLSARYALKIYSLSMLRGRVYVVNSPELVLSCQRLPKTVSFWFIEGQFSAKLGGMSNEASERVVENLRGEQVDHSMFVKGLRATHQAMMPGPEVDAMVQVTTQMIATALEQFEVKPEARRINLWKWVQHEMTIATTESVYGPMNPYRDPEVEKGFWDFVDDTIMLLTGIMPSVLASKGYVGREKVVAAFEKYFAAKGQQKGSPLTKVRNEILSQEFVANDTARFECVNGVALLANTIPTTFWTVYHVFSDSAILRTVREQVGACLTIQEEGGVISRILDVSMLRETTVLTSILHESLRHRTSGAGARMVLEDVLLDNRYLLKKDSFLILPNHELHFDESVWGGKAQDFDCQRFVKSNSNKIRSGAFRGFGGGVNLCPGKNFATTEIVVMIAMLALKFDIRPAAASGQWVDPQQDTSNMSLAIAPPRDGLIVDVVPRKGWAGGSWGFRY